MGARVADAAVVGMVVIICFQPPQFMRCICIAQRTDAGRPFRLFGRAHETRNFPPFYVIRKPVLKRFERQVCDSSADER